MKKIVHIISLAIFSVLMLACDFDGRRQADIQYPVTLEIQNKSQSDITIHSIYNSADSIEGFVLNGELIKSSKSLKFKISETTANEIVAAKYAIDSSCNGNNWTMSGKDLSSSVIKNNIEWRVIVTLADCIKKGV